MVGCQPSDLNSSTAACTTGTTATAALKRQHVDVGWLSCTGGCGKGASAGGTPSPTETTVVSVHCQGETKDRRKIVVAGVVTKAVDGACVRGDLTGRVGGRQVFHVSGLGDCDATAVPGPTHEQPTVTVTVTPTRASPPRKGDPTCWPARGK
ncbi:hypothetical protein ACH47Z_04170 [Streptomyces sp. NPDC020192]|uniref:hypothetical protein n=1 Tax=Streptomyces sp. NPDC020192 TaxID=3365066 RepID=UPI003795C852